MINIIIKEELVLENIYEDHSKNSMLHPENLLQNIFVMVTHYHFL